VDPLLLEGVLDEGDADAPGRQQRGEDEADQDPVQVVRCGAPGAQATEQEGGAQPAAARRDRFEQSRVVVVAHQRIVPWTKTTAACRAGTAGNGPDRVDIFIARPGRTGIDREESGVKFDMGQATLSTLAKSTQGSSDDLGSLIKQLIDAAAPLEGKFNGAGRAAFDSFKGRADQIAAVLGGQTGMDSAFGQGDTEMSDNARTTEQSANFDAARFSAR
jgi:uncharacterized protein YukE